MIYIFHLIIEKKSMFIIKTWKMKLSKPKWIKSPHNATIQQESFVPVYNWMFSEAHFSGQAMRKSAKSCNPKFYAQFPFN